MSHRPAIARANRRVGFAVAGVAAGMIALAFASAPLYRLFCQVTGYGGRSEEHTS